MNAPLAIPLPDPAIADGAGLEAHRVHTVPVVVISPHNQCDCRCVMCDIWKIRDAEQLSVADLERQIASFRDLGVRWVVFSGGEPQKNDQLSALAQVLRAAGIRITLLTAGLLLHSQAETIAKNMDDVIVSLDGPPVLHDRIRRVPGAFERLAAGVRELRRLRPDIPVCARCTVQKLNHASLCVTTDSAREIGLNSISFLAADVSSEAFNRPSLWAAERKQKVALSAAEVETLEEEIHRLIDEHADDLASGFIVEGPDKLQRIVLHFRACLGQREPVSPRCNAPWVSAVIEAGGDVRPCFFHRSLGNIHKASLGEILNGPRALQFRSGLNIATNPTCRQCVCSLYVPNPET
jgi:MoaA/NifB/PqqE/SkfB family radical SAM enzyme